MIPELKEYQKKIIQEDKKQTGIFMGTGVGKSAISLHLANNTPHCKCLIVCNKQQFLDRTFERTKELFELSDLNLTVISKEQLKKRYKELQLEKWDTVIFDEAHKIFSGVSSEHRFVKGIKVPKMSQLFEITKDFLEMVKPERLYFLTATPASKSMRVYAMATLFGKKWDYFKFRDKYYHEIRLSAYSGRWIERKKKDLKDKLAEVVRGFGYTGTLFDWFDVPEPIHLQEYFELTPQQKKEMTELEAKESDPLVFAGKQRAIENGIAYDYIIETKNNIDTVKRISRNFNNEKLERIIELAEEFPRMLIFARYTAQIEMIEKALKKEGYDVVCLTGKTKDRKDVILEADKRDCIVIAQAQISEGYELKTFRCIVFASKSPMAEDYNQSLGRNLRLDAIHQNIFIHLIVKGGADERCHQSILSGQDFQELLSAGSGSLET